MAKTEKNSCLGHCPNWIWRYRVGRKLAKKKRDLKLCIEEGRRYIQIERPASLSAGYLSSEKCWEFDSRKPAYEELMCALEDDDVTMIGLYGMGGCGKTMLAMEVGKRCGHLFDQVVFVPISSTVDVERIQEKIAGSLEFEFQEKDEMDRSQRLCMRFTQEDRVLVILDDVWQMLDFDAIGIPSSEHHKGCKVLISSRSEAVCTLMDCQKKFHLSTLTNDETWDLFRKQALISECTSITVQSLARQISNECKGLPVAIVAVASSLKGKAEVEWKVALDRLRSSKPVNIEKGLQNPYKCLQLSYDNLDTEEAKSLFLLCSVFPEDCEIPVEFLTRSAIGLGIVGEVHSYEGARDEVSVAKNKLISSCLLLDVDEGKCVKMHDLVRNVAHWIAENEIKCASEKDIMTLEHTSLRYLWCEKFPTNLYFSNLDFLHIHTLTQVSDEIFKGMRMLRVLFLYNKGRERRPLLTMSLKSLTNLRCILLSKWDLVDVSFVGDMKKLESLTLCDCSFLELPDVVTQLTNLRLLDLSECDMKMNPFEVIGRHRQLEELYFADCKSKWEVEFLKEFSVPQVLQRYQIQLGSMFSGFQEESLNHHRTLFLSYLDISNAAIKDLAEKAEVLCIAGIEGGAKSIIPDIFQSMNHLTELLIRDTKGIECLVDTCLIEVGTLFFCKLHWLRIEHMEHLGALYNGRMPLGGHFENLEDLYISHCPKLACLFTLAVAQNLAQLEKLQVLSCPALKHILIDDDDREEIIVYDHRPLFPKLKELHVRECSELEYIIPITLAQGLVQLECMEIVCNHKLRYVFGQSTHKDGQNQNEIKIELSALQELTLVILPNINSICPEDCYLMWPSLLSFNLQNCAEFFMVSINTCMALHNNPMINKASHQTLQNIKEVRINNCELEGIFQLVGLPIDGEKDPPTSCLEMLYLENLPQLRYVCKSDVESTNLQFQNLQQMEICGCRRLKFIFSSCMAGGLPQLKALKIEKCNQLDKIVEDIGTAVPLGTQTSTYSWCNSYVKLRLFYQVSIVSKWYENFG
jgi:Leucine-rich repeat (LRR) protein